MTEVAPASEDSSSSSSHAPLGGFNNNNNNYSTSSSTIINTPFSSPQSQQQPSSSSTTSSTTSRKPRRFLQQKLDIPPRQFDQVNQVSVVKMSDKLTSTTTNNKVSTASSLCASTLLSVVSTNGNQKQVSPNSCLSLASSATTSPSLASRSSHNNNNHSTNCDSAKTSPFFNCSSAASSCYSSSSSQMQESGGRTLSNISSIPSSLPSPQVTSANNVPQFGGSTETNKATQQEGNDDDNDNNDSNDAGGKDTFSPTSGHFTASLVHPNIYLGAAIDANNAAELIARGIFFILNVAYECDFADSVMNCPQIQKKKINLRDTVQENIEPSFEEAFSFIDAAIEQNKKILVHCFMGASRSATIVIAYIMRKLAEKDLCEQVFVATRSSIISKHQQCEREETNKSPTMIDSLRIFPPPPPSASGSSTSTQAFPPTTSAAIENQQQQQQQQQTVSFPVVTTTTSDNGSSSSSTSSSSSSSYYFTALDQVQKVRPEILPNLAFCTALHKMDDELMLRSTAVVC